jgi:bifunctional DNA-binding transcriptional regulator/antitoxin component of YhaV-PrlF toxin-antitoxin module
MTTPAITKMSSKGQVVIPEAIRKRLGLEPGTEFVSAFWRASSRPPRWSIAVANVNDVVAVRAKSFHQSRRERVVNEQPQVPVCKGNCRSSTACHPSVQDRP